MKSDYDCYLLGCRDWGVKPVGRWRFQVAYAKYQQARRREMDAIPPIGSKRRGWVRARWTGLQGLADLVRHGRDLAVRARRDGGEYGDSDPGSNGAGTREPLLPREPVLAGGATRPLPPRRRDDETAHWWQI